jgi:hypothetical protein
MGDLQWYDVLRLVSFSLFTAGAFYTIRSSRRHWSSYTERDKDYLWAFLALVLLMAVGGLEAIRRDTPMDWRTILAFAVACVSSRAAIKGRHYTDRPFKKSNT